MLNTRNQNEATQSAAAKAPMSVGKILLISAVVAAVVGGLAAIIIFAILPAAGVQVLQKQNADVKSYDVLFTSSQSCTTFLTKKADFINEVAFIAAIDPSAVKITKTVQGGDGKCYIYVNIQGTENVFVSADQSFEKAVDNNPDLDAFYIVGYTDNPGEVVVSTPAPTAAPTAAPDVTPAPTQPSSVDLKINVGSNFPYTHQGKTFIADYNGLPEVQNGVKFTLKTNQTGNLLIDTSRFFAFMVPGDGYHLPVPNNKYDVTVYLAEVSTNITAGQRTFQILLEGTSGWGIVEPLKLAGYNYLTLATLTKTVDVSDGVLDITFIKGGQNPSINALEIVTSTN